MELDFGILNKIRNSDCKDCELYKSAQAVCLIGMGKVPSDLMLVGEAPGLREGDLRKPFSGKAGQLLDRILNRFGLCREDIFITNAVKCRPPDNRSPTLKEIEACRKYLLKEIEIVKPKVILLLGSSACRSFGYSSAISKIRGEKLLWKDNIILVPTFHPSAALRDASGKIFDLIKEDLKLALDFSRGIDREERTFKCKYLVLRDSSLFDKVLSLFEEEDKGVVIDVESNSLEVYRPEFRIRVISFSLISLDRNIILEVENIKLDEVSDFVKRIFEIMERKRIPLIAHNAKFDLSAIRSFLGVRYKGLVEDTMILSYIKDENPPHSLEALGRRLGFPNWKIDVREIHEGDIKKVGLYCLKDVLVTKALFEEFQEVKRQNLFLYNFLLKVEKILDRAEERGIRVNKGLLKLLNKLYEERKRIVLSKILSSKEAEEFRRDTGSELNLNSPIQLSYFLYKICDYPVLETSSKSKIPSTSSDVLEKLAEKGGIVKDILVYKKIEKFLSTFILPLESQSILDPVSNDLIVHPRFKITGTVSGRISCEDPNIQQIPRVGAIRFLFCPRSRDSLFLSVDFSQAELKVAAYLSKDPNLIRILNSEGDIHREIASLIFKKPVESITESERKFAKKVSFGVLYGITPKGLAKRLDCSEKEAESLISMFYSQFPELRKWILSQHQKAEQEGVVYSPVGRKRSLAIIGKGDEEGAKRIAVNFPIQSFSSDLNFISLIKLESELKKLNYKVFPVAFIHDAVIFEVSSDCVLEISELIQRVWQNPIEDSPVKFKGDVSVGREWGSLIPVDKYFSIKDFNLVRTVLFLSNLVRVTEEIFPELESKVSQFLGGEVEEKEVLSFLGDVVSEVFELRKEDFASLISLVRRILE